jgi:predicted enzyme related to lactoylglutathione lyase
MPRVVHFEINADNPDRAVKFYENVFGWIIEKWEGPMDYWLISTGKDEPGIDGAIMRRDKPLSGKNGLIAYLCTISVTAVDEYIKKIEQAGGKVVQPKTAIPGFGYYANCQDTEGNLFGIMHYDTSAK